MEKFFTLALAVGMSLGTTAALVKYYPPNTHNAEALLANDAAYRDGLFLGKRAAKSGTQSQAPVGRWSAEKDRASFRAGYEHAYHEFAQESHR